MYDRILYAHDFCEHSKPVLRAALDLGRQLKATVHILHVVTPPLSIPPGLWFSVPSPDLATFEKLLSMGAKQYQPITPRGDTGFVTASVIDPFGNVLGIMYNPHYVAAHAARAA